MSAGCRIRRNFERPAKELVEAFRGIPVANMTIIAEGSRGRCKYFPRLNPKARLLERHSQ